MLVGAVNINPNWQKHVTLGDVPTRHACKRHKVG